MFNKGIIFWFFLLATFLFGKPLLGQSDKLQANNLFQFKRLDSLISLARNDLKLGNVEQGIHYLDSLRDQAALRHDTLQAYVLHKICIAYSVDLNEPDSAIFYQKKAIALREMHFPKNHSDLIKGYSYLGRYFLRLRNDYQLDSAQLYLQKSITLNNSRDKPTSELGLTYLYLGRVYKDKEDYLAAVQTFRASINELKRDRKFRNQLIVFNELAQLYAIYLNQPDSALFYSNQALDVYQKIVSKSKYKKSLANCYISKAISLVGKKQFSQAIASYEKAEKLYEESGHKIGKRIALNNKARVYNKLKQFNNSIRLLKVAVKANKNANDVLNLSINFDNLGDAFVGIDKLDSSIYYYNKSLQQVIVNFLPKKLTDNPSFVESSIADKDGVLVTMNSKAISLENYYLENRELLYLNTSLSCYAYLDSLLDYSRLDLQSEISKNYLVGKAKSIYESAIRVCIRLYDATQDLAYIHRAFHFSEKSRGIIQLGALRNLKAIEQTSQGQLSSSLETLRKRIQFFENQLAWGDLYQDIDSEARQRLLDSVIVNRGIYDKTILQLERENPNYYNMRYNMQTIPLTQLQKNQLQADQALVEYFIEDSNAYAFVITKEKVDLIELKGGTEIRPLIQQMRQGMYGFYTQNEENLPPSHFNRMYQHAAKELYEMLIKPLGQLPADLILVPDGYLGHLPFEALITTDVGPGEISYWVGQKTISYAVSATLLAEMEQSRPKKKARYTWGGFAPVFDNGDAPVLASPDITRSASAPLLWSEKEVISIHELMQGEVFLREGATHQTFSDRAPHYGIIHVSTHGEVNDQDARFNYLAFWDTLMYAADINQLPRLNAEMVVLSACNTAFGEVRQGEGIYNLARSFSYAGAASIVPTLWKVNDQTTARFMELFYQHLKQGASKAEALQQTKLQFIEAGENPFYWAGYIIIGDATPLELPLGFPSWAYFLVPVLILATVWFFRRQIRNFF